MKAITVYGALTASILLSVAPAHSGLTNGTNAAGTWAFVIDNHPGLRNLSYQARDTRSSFPWAAPSITAGRLAVPGTNTMFHRHSAPSSSPIREEGPRDKPVSMPGVPPIDAVFNMDAMVHTGGYMLPGMSTLPHAGSDAEIHRWKAGDSRWRARRGRWVRLTAQSIPAPEAVVLAGLSTSLIGWLRRPRLM